ncbi:MAG TPA: hypothetical protein VL860_02450, partial [Planctomycetota bacterium]|nr:hypothetical protein [Planctomycetota bacterium]
MTMPIPLRRSAPTPHPWPTPVLLFAIFCFCLAGCGEPPRLISPPVEDPRGGTAREIDAAALYASGLQHAWSGEYGQALAELRQADHLAPEQPLVLAAIGFALDDLAHPEDAPAAGTANPAPNTAPLRRESLDAEAYDALYRAALLNCDDARVYERLAAHWYRLSKRPAGESNPDDERLRQEAERRSAQYSLQALQHLVIDGDTELAHQKSLVYITHLGKYYRQHGLVAEELAVVQIHRRLDPADLGLQLDEIELLFLTRQLAPAESRLEAFQTENPKLVRPAGPNGASGSGVASTGPLQRRVNWARMLGRRLQAALRTDSQWPHNPVDPAATAHSPYLHWLEEPLGGMDDLFKLFWQDFDHTP